MRPFSRKRMSSPDRSARVPAHPIQRAASPTGGYARTRGRRTGRTRARRPLRPPPKKQTSAPAPQSRLPPPGPSKRGAPLLPQPRALRPQPQGVRGVLQRARGLSKPRSAPRCGQRLKAREISASSNSCFPPAFQAGSVMPPEVPSAALPALQDAATPGRFVLPVPRREGLDIGDVEGPAAAPPAGRSPREPGQRARKLR